MLCPVEGQARTRHATAVVESIYNGSYCGLRVFGRTSVQVIVLALLLPSVLLVEVSSCLYICTHQNIHIIFTIVVKKLEAIM